MLATQLLTVLVVASLQRYRFTEQGTVLANAKAALLTAESRAKGLDAELEETVKHNSGLLLQVDALGFALGKMKGVVDVRCSPLHYGFCHQPWIPPCLYLDRCVGR
jgi:hypothetical protein